MRVETYPELVNAISYLVARGEEQGVLNLFNYTQDVEADLNRACLEVIQEDPLGAYSVEQISHDYSLIVSYYEVHLQITYRRSREQVASITSLSGSSALRRTIGQSLSEFNPETVLQVSYFAENEAFILDLVRQAYYDSPATAMGMPKIEIEIYPDSGSQRIVEILLTYPDAPETLRRQGQELMTLVQTLTAEGATAQSLYDLVTDGLAVSDLPGNSSTYDALVHRNANNEGVALAYQLLCDQAGIPCTLVRGTLDRSTHFWNIVQTESGEYRHMDLSAGLSFLTDEELSAAGPYGWDTVKYPSCLPTTPQPEEENF